MNSYFSNIFTFPTYLLSFTLQANIHSIMDAEPQVESLMQLLNDALKELENLDKRLTGYDSRLKVNSLIPSYSVEILLLSKCYF